MFFFRWNWSVLGLPKWLLIPEWWRELPSDRFLERNNLDPLFTRESFGKVPGTRFRPSKNTPEKAAVFETTASILVESSGLGFDCIDISARLLLKVGWSYLIYVLVFRWWYSRLKHLNPHTFGQGWIIGQWKMWWGGPWPRHYLLRHGAKLTG